MKLTTLIDSIDEVDEEAIIFQSNLEDFNSDIILYYAEPDDNGIKEEDGIKYYYLLEVFLAKEFIEDWLNSLDYKPSLEETAKRLFEYAINDA